MTIDLAPIDALLASAAVDADRVRQLSDDWAADAIRETTTLDTDRGVQVHRAEAVGDPPAEIAKALSDVLQQCRAALDDTLVALLSGPPTSESGFLIAATAKRFDAERGRCLAGVPDWAVEVLRSLQPMRHNTWRQTGRYLAQLHELTTEDRHHAIHVAGGVFDVYRTFGNKYPGELSFRVQDDGRVMVLETRAPAEVPPEFEAAVIVQEPCLRDRHRDTDTLYPAAGAVAHGAVSAVEQTLILVRHAAWKAGITIK